MNQRFIWDTGQKLVRRPFKCVCIAICYISYGLRQAFKQPWVPNGNRRETCLLDEGRSRATNSMCHRAEGSNSPSKTVLALMGKRNRSIMSSHSNGSLQPEFNSLHQITTVQMSRQYSRNNKNVSACNFHSYQTD